MEYYYSNYVICIIRRSPYPAMKKSKPLYAPNKRGFFEQKPRRMRSYSARDYSVLPDPVRDPIVSNNISNVEFDYTYDRGDQI